MCSCARMGDPAATRPSGGKASWARLGSWKENCLLRDSLMERSVSLLRRMPREVPLISSMAPLRASACKCSSAALADLKPSSVAISARVGGAPVRAMALWVRSRICCCRAVSLGLSSMTTPLKYDGYAVVAIDKIAELTSWPRVEIVLSYAGSSGAVVDALLGPGAQAPALHGIV